MVRRLAQGAIALTAVALALFAWHCDAPWFDRHVFLPQQFFLRASPGIASSARAIALAIAAILLLFARFLPRGAAGRRLFFALLLSILAAEILLQWRVRRLVRPELAAAMEALTMSHPRYGGFTFRPSLDQVHRILGREIRFRTDGESRRISGAAIDPAAPSIVFTGESAMAGFGLEWDETFAAALGARLRLQVVNLASPGYRAEQSALRLKDALPKLQHPAAVVGIFMPGLIGRSFADPRHPPLRRSSSPALVQRSGLYQLWHHLYWSDAAIEEGLRSVASALREMSALAQARGAPCIFLVTGWTPSWMLHDLFEAPGLDFVPLDFPDTDLLPDAHPGPRAILRITDALETRLRAAMPTAHPR
ncbi:MAG TPA: hypothetical protein VFA79_15740 [Myxococcales bacterium]|nr:hypothetical protein [Myxococcales bacterium]